MKDEYNWFRVVEDGNFYNGMVGRCIRETEKTLILEIPMSEKLGGLQRVQFFKEQVVFDGTY